MSREVCDHGRIFHGPCPACDALAPEPTYTAADIETIIQRGLELAKEQRNIDLAAAVETAVTAAVLDHGQAWQDIADHLGGLCLGGVDVRANQQQICAEIDARVAAAYKRGMEAGRKERTVEIDKTYGSYHLGDAKRNPMHKLSIELRFDYPECFGEEAEKP